MLWVRKTFRKQKVTKNKNTGQITIKEI